MLDPLTHTIDGSLLRYLLDHEIQRAMRYTYFFSLLEVQSDGKPDPATFATLGQLIREKVRSTDLIGRIEEGQFCVLLHHAEAQHTFQIARRIQDRIRDHSFSSEQGPRHYTVSIGGACFPTHANDLRLLMSRAREMRERAYSDGGNRIYLAE